MQHKVTTLDAQPSSATVASLIVSVTGLLVVRQAYLRYGTVLTASQFLSLQVDDSPNPLQYSQVFQLIPDGGSYYV